MPRSKWPARSSCISLRDETASGLGAAGGGGGSETTGDALIEQGTWSYGLWFLEALPDGDVAVVHYAGGPEGGTDIRWIRLGLDE